MWANQKQKTFHRRPLSTMIRHNVADQYPRVYMHLLLGRHQFLGGRRSAVQDIHDLLEVVFDAVAACNTIESVKKANRAKQKEPFTSVPPNRLPNVPKSTTPLLPPTRPVVGSAQCSPPPPSPAPHDSHSHLEGG